MSVRLTLDECGRQRHLQGLPSGTYQIEYTDSTHLQPTEWVRLATIDVRSAAIPLEGSQTEQFFTLRKDVGDLPGKPQPASNDRKNNDRSDPLAEYNRRIRVIEDTLSLALGRVGLLAPEVSPELLEQLLKLDEQDGVVIVPDTNALHNGAVHWLLRVLHRPAVWLMPVVASLTTIQTRDATVKGLVNKAKITNLGQALRSRGLVNGSLGLFERNKGRCQVVEIDPSLLRYQKMASSSGTDPDQGDVLEDRLIIEAIHGVLRSMRSRTARRVVTSDVNIARVLAAEGIETLFVPSIAMRDEPVDCLRFDALARNFVGAPLRAALWELAHAFGTVRFLSGDAERARLDCYWPGKTPSEWGSETLLCEFMASPGSATLNAQSAETVGQGLDLVPAPQTPQSVTEATGLREAEAEAQTLTAPRLAETPRPDAAGSARAKNGQVSPEAPASPLVAGNPLGQGNELLRLGGAQKPARRTAAPKRVVPITTNLPRASLPQMLRLLGIARRLNGGTAEQLVEELRTDPLSADKARRPLEILRRLGLVDQIDDVYHATPDAEIVDVTLRSGDLDSLSTLLERFAPYQAFLQALRERSRVRRADAAALVQSLIGPAGTAESDRLPRFHVLLGQAWTDGEWIVDGSNRPTDRDATDAFEEAFRLTQSVGIAKMHDLLLRYCEMTKMSPWAAKRQIERFVAARMMPQFSFQPAAGAKPITRDEVVAGSLDQVELQPVIVDRVFLGERPVFTVEGPSQ